MTANAIIDFYVFIQYTREKWALIGNSEDAIRMAQKDIASLGAQQPLAQNIFCYETDGVLLLRWQDVGAPVRKALVTRWKKVADRNDQDMQGLRTEIGIVAITIRVTPPGKFQVPAGVSARHYGQAATMGRAEQNNASALPAPILCPISISPSANAAQNLSTAIQIPSSSGIATLPVSNASDIRNEVAEVANLSTTSSPRQRPGITTMLPRPPQIANASLESSSLLPREAITTPSGNPAPTSSTLPNQPTRCPPPIPAMPPDAPANSADADATSPTMLTPSQREEYVRRLFVYRDQSQKQLREAQAKEFVVKRELERIGVRKRVEAPRTVDDLTAELDAANELLRVERRRRAQAEKQLGEMAAERQKLHLIPAMLEAFKEISAMTDAIATGAGP